MYLSFLILYILFIYFKKIYELIYLINVVIKICHISVEPLQTNQILSLMFLERRSLGRILNPFVVMLKIIFAKSTSSVSHLHGCKWMQLKGNSTALSANANLVVLIGLWVSCNVILQIFILIELLLFANFNLKLIQQSIV